MRRFSFSLGLATALALIAGSASAGTITISSATVNATSVVVNGNATFTDGAFVSVATDGAADTTSPAHAAAGGDLTGASIATTVAGQLKLRWSLASLPPSGAPPSGIVYGWIFCVSGGSCFEVDAGGINVTTQDSDGYGVLWRCATDACVAANQTTVRDDVAVVFDTAAKTATATLTLAELGAAGKTLTEATGTLPDVFAGTGDAGLATFQYNVGDTITSVEEYAVPTKSVSLKLGAPDQDPAAVTYSNSVSVLANGNFGFALDRGGLNPGAYEVYARGCFGMDNCAYASQDVTLS
jgi:hypothetical protein